MILRTPFSSHTFSHERFIKLLGIVLTIAFACRAVVTFSLDLPWASGDTRAYLDMATNILAGTPRAYLPNGYPLFIAGMRAVLGEALLIPALQIVNVLASTATVGVIAVLGRRIAGERIGVFAALGVALYPNQINAVRYLLTESITGFLLVIGMLLFLVPRRLLSGAAFYVVTLFRSTYSLLLPILVIISLAFREPKISLSRFVIGILIPASLYGLLLVGGVLRPSNNLGVNFLISIHNRSHAGIVWPALDEYSEQERAHPVRAYVAFARDHPDEFVIQRLSSLWTLWGPMAPMGSGDLRRSLGSALLLGLRFPLLLLALVGIFRNRGNRAVWVVAAPLFAVTLVHTIFFSSHRFTVPIEPLLILLAFLGVSAIVTRFRDKAKPA